MKQISRILKNVNYDTSNIKLVKCLAVHNEEDWVEYNLRNNYDEFDIIRIVEGAVEGRPLSTEDGHSTDKTLELIRNFPDPDDKIELYTLDRPFKSLEEQKQLFVEFASEGEWLFIVDCDEFYMEGDVNRVRKAIEKYPAASEIIPTFLHFYRDFFHIRDLHPEWTLNHQRIVRYREGLRYHTHPVVTDAQGQCTYFSNHYQPDRFTIPIFIYHYGHAKGIEFHRMKHEFYKSELEKFKLEDGLNAADKFDEKFIEFMEYKESLDEVLIFDGSHPECLKTHPIFDSKEEFYKDKDIKNWKQSEFYSRFPNIPTIPQWMLNWPWANARMPEFYNLVNV